MIKKPPLQPGSSIGEAGLTLSVAEDALSATLKVVYRFASRWTAERVLRFLHSHGIVHGIKPAAVHAIFNEKKFNEPVLVASGVQATRAIGARVKPFFRYDEIYEALQGCADTESFAQEAIRRLSIKYNKPIAQQIPGTEGSDGKDVLGNILPARDPNEELLTPGIGTVLSPYTLQLLARRDGIVSYDGTAFRVVGVQVHEGHALPKDYGEVAEGTIVIIGSVRPDAVVRAEGDVIVCGAVEAAEIHADGSVIIGGTLEGGKGGKRVSVTAGGYVFARSAKHANVSAGHSIWIFGSAMRFILKAGRYIHICGGNARAFGGTLQAELQIHAEEIGSEYEIPTILVVGQRMCELGRHAADLKTELEAQEKQLEKVRSLAGVLQELEAREGSLPPDKEQMLLTVGRTEGDLRTRVETLRSQLNNLEEQIQDLQRQEHIIQCTGTIWPGTKIHMGRFPHLVNQLTSNTKFALTQAGIESRPLKEKPTQPSLLAGLNGTTDQSSRNRIS